MIGLIRKIQLNRNLKNPLWVINQIGKPFEKPNTKGLARLEKIAIAIEEQEGKQIHLISAKKIDKTNRVVLVDNEWRKSWNKYCKKGGFQKFTGKDVLEMSIFSTKGNRKVI